MPMKTKAFVRFLNRVAHFDADLELADVLNIAKDAGKLHSAGGTYIFDDVDATRHPRLASRDNSEGGRTIAIGHLKSTLYSSFLKDLYEDVTAYLQEILAEAAMNGLDPNRLVGEHRVTTEANDILACGNWENVVSLVAGGIFRRLENLQDTKSLLQKINDKLNLGVGQQKIQDALPYLEIRHLLVHNDGVADASFCQRFPGIGATENAKIVLGHQQIKQARQTIIDLVSEYDTQVVAHNIVGHSFLQP